MSAINSIVSTQSSSYCTDRISDAAASVTAHSISSPSPVASVVRPSVIRKDLSVTPQLQQETASMTLRRVPADYSKRLEDANSRTAAMERYREMVRNARTTTATPPSKSTATTAEAPASSAAAVAATAVAAAAAVENANRAPVRHALPNPPPPATREISIRSTTVSACTSDDDDNEAAVTAAPVLSNAVRRYPAPAPAVYVGGTNMTSATTAAAVAARILHKRPAPGAVTAAAAASATPTPQLHESLNNTTPQMHRQQHTRVMQLSVSAPTDTMEPSESRSPTMPHADHCYSPEVQPVPHAVEVGTVTPPARSPQSAKKQRVAMGAQSATPRSDKKKPRRTVQDEHAHDEGKKVRASSGPGTPSRKSKKISHTPLATAIASHVEADENDDDEDKEDSPFAWEEGRVYSKEEMLQEIATAPVPLNPRRNGFQPNYKPVYVDATEGIDSKRKTVGGADGGASATKQDMQTPEVSREASPYANRSSVKRGRSASDSQQEHAKEEPKEDNTVQRASAHKEAAEVEEEAAANTVEPSQHTVQASSRKARKSTKKEEDVIQLGGGSSAFWVRPSSALYEMTASIAAKRRDHPETPRDSVPVSTATATSATNNTSSSSSLTSARASRRDSRPSFTTALSAPVGRLTTFETMALEAAAADKGRPSARPCSARASKIRSPRPSRITTGGATTSEGQIQRVSTRLRPRVSARLHQPNSPRSVTGSSLAASSGGAGDSPNRLTSTHHSSVNSELNSVPVVAPKLSAAAASRVVDRQGASFSKHCSRVSARSTAEKPTAAAERVPVSARRAAFERLHTTRSSISFSSSSVPVSAAATDVGPLEKQPVQRGGSGIAKGSTAIAPKKSSLKTPRVSVAANATGSLQSSIMPASGRISKKLQFELDEVEAPVNSTEMPPEERRRRKQQQPVPTRPANDDGDGDDPVPNNAAPRATGRLSGKAVGLPQRRHAEPAPVATAAGDQVTPCKTRRRQYDSTASPVRPEDEDTRVDAMKSALETARRTQLSSQKGKEAAVSTVSEAARATTPRLSTMVRCSTNEVVASMLQGIVQQSRCVIPCYLCAEMQNTSTYKLHLEGCRASTLSLLQDWDGAVTEESQQVLSHMERLPAPLSTSSEEERNGFAFAAYACAKALLVPCRKCNTRLRVHDAREHELLCGRSYYASSKAAQRAKAVVTRIEEGAAKQ